MKKSKIIAHSLIKNESRWIWFALNSVLDFVDEIMVWDTGSTDSTVEIVHLINSSKIKFRQLDPVDALGHTAARQAMLEASDCDWILILDGDEIWWRESLVAHLQLITNNLQLNALISPFVNLVGDIYHYQDPKHSHYQIGDLTGAYNLRFINRKIEGLHVANPHGRQEYRNQNEIPLQNFPGSQVTFVDHPYLHTTHLTRSDKPGFDKHTLKRDFKYRYELGHRFSNNFFYPEVFYLPRPKVVPDPWIHRTSEYILKSWLFDFGRTILPKKSKSGY